MNLFFLCIVGLSGGGTSILLVQKNFLLFIAPYEDII